MFKYDQMYENWSVNCVSVTESQTLNPDMDLLNLYLWFVFQFVINISDFLQQ